MHRRLVIIISGLALAILSGCGSGDGKELAADSSLVPPGSDAAGAPDAGPPRQDGQAPRPDQMPDRGDAGAIECSDDGECTKPLICNTGVDTPICALPHPAGGDCLRDEDCVAPLHCLLIPDDEGYGTCGTPGGDGAECYTSDDCAPPLTCNYGFDPLVCKPKQAQGGPCGDDDDCNAGLFCSQSDTPPVCKPQPTPGGPCPCPDPLVCNAGYDPPQCQPLGADGAICSEDPECQPGLMCNYGLEPARCKAPQPVGGPCSFDGDCQTGLTCDSATSKCKA